MPRIRRGPIPQTQPADTEDEEDFFGGAPPEETDADLVLPALPGSPPAPPPKSMVELGPPPKNPMAAAQWAYDLLMLQAYETMIEEGLSQETRRKEIRIILGAAAKHMTDAMRYETARTIERHRQVIEARKRQRAAAVQEPRRPAPASAKVIPIRRQSGESKS